MIIPESKKDIVSDTRKKIVEVEGQFNKGIITRASGRTRSSTCGPAHRQDRQGVFAKLESNDGKPEINPVYIMMDSGPAATSSRSASSAARAASWPSRPAKSSSARSCPRSARA